MKKNIIFIILLTFLFAFSCTFNLFEGDVESNYNAIKDPALKINYAREILASGNKDKIDKVIQLLKADIENNLFTDPKLKAEANQIVGNLIISQSGFNEVVSNVISQLITSTSSGGDSTNTNIVVNIVDFDGNGEINNEDLTAIQEMLEQLSSAATYINEAAQAQPENLDLQLQNVIANIAAAATAIFDSAEGNAETLEQLQSYFSGESNTPPEGYDQIQDYVNNIAQSVNNMLTYAEEGSIYYQIAQTLNEIFQNITF